MYNKKLMDYEFLLMTEKETINKTEEIYRILSQKIVESINVFFAIPYFVGNAIGSDTFDQTYHSIAQHNYIRLPYTFKTIYSLIQTGYYLESSILIRSLYEILVQLRYFQNHREKYTDYLTNKVRVSFKEMFEEISKGLYDEIYRLFSNFSHGGIGTINFRAKYEKKDKGSLIYGCEYDETRVLFVIGHQLKLAYGFLNYAPKFFPEFYKNVHQNIEENRKGIITWIDEMNKKNMEIDPKYKKLSDLVGKLIN
jgi:hypothetical protein